MRLSWSLALLVEVMLSGPWSIYKSHPGQCEGGLQGALCAVELVFPTLPMSLPCGCSPIPCLALISQEQCRPKVGTGTYGFGLVWGWLG